MPGVIFHHDNGSQYTSDDFARTTAFLGVTCSVRRAVTCFDNAVAESFFATLKKSLSIAEHSPLAHERDGKCLSGSKGGTTAVDFIQHSVTSHRLPGRNTRHNQQKLLNNVSGRRGKFTVHS